MEHPMTKPLMIALVLFANTALAADAEYTITIRDHRFEPTELEVPAGKKIKLRIENKDATPEEFESHELNREKIVPGNGATSIYVGPLDAGRYPFYGEFNAKTAQGALVAK
jgi:hypothetical protein